MAAVDEFPRTFRILTETYPNLNFAQALQTKPTPAPVTQFLKNLKAIPALAPHADLSPETAWKNVLATLNEADFAAFFLKNTAMLYLLTQGQTHGERSVSTGSAVEGKTLVSFFYQSACHALWPDRLSSQYVYSNVRASKQDPRSFYAPP